MSQKNGSDMSLCCSFFTVLILPALCNRRTPKRSDSGLAFHLPLPLVITSAPTASNGTALGSTAMCGWPVLTSLPSATPDF